MIRSDNLDFTKTTPIAWMKGREALTLDNMPDKDHFIIVNPEEIGKDLVEDRKEKSYVSLI